MAGSGPPLRLRRAGKRRSGRRRTGDSVCLRQFPACARGGRRETLARTRARQRSRAPLSRDRTAQALRRRRGGPAVRRTPQDFVFGPRARLSRPARHPVCRGQRHGCCPHHGRARGCGCRLARGAVRVERAVAARGTRCQGAGCGGAGRRASRRLVAGGARACARACNLRAGPRGTETLVGTRRPG